MPSSASGPPGAATQFSTLSAAGTAVVACVGEIGGHLEKLVTNGKKVHSFVRYQTWDEAVISLSEITACLETKGYVVEHSEVVGDLVKDLNLEVPGYNPDVPYPPASGTPSG